MVKRGDTWDGVFADPEVGRVLKSKGLIADANKSSIEELTTITTLNPSGGDTTGYFYNNKVITKFPELEYCTGLSDEGLLGAFRECSNLIEAPTIPEGVTNIRQIFYGCSNLTEFGEIPNSVTNMASTFNRCSSLVKAPNIPEGVTNMGATFYQCTSLINAPIIPKGVTNMYNTFYKCSSLDDIFIIKPITPPTYGTTFSSVNVVAIYVPDESVNTYKSAEGWSDHSSKIYPMSQLPE